MAQNWLTMPPHVPPSWTVLEQYLAPCPLPPPWEQIVLASSSSATSAPISTCGKQATVSAAVLFVGQDKSNKRYRRRHGTKKGQGDSP